MNINKPHDSTRQTLISHASQRRQLSDYTIIRSTTYTTTYTHIFFPPPKWPILCRVGR